MSTEVIDLMARLQESLDAARGTRGATHPRARAAAKKSRARPTHRAKRGARQSA